MPTQPDFLSADADDALLLAYNETLKTLAAAAAEPCRLTAPQFSAQAASAICGSRVTLDVCLDEDGCICALGFDAQACNLTRAVLGIMASAAIGEKPADVFAAETAMVRLLDGAAAPLPARWQALSFVTQVREYRSRHASLRLPFAALRRALATDVP